VEPVVLSSSYRESPSWRGGNEKPNASVPRHGSTGAFGGQVSALLLAAAGVFRLTLREWAASRVCGRCPCEVEAVELPELLEPRRWRDFCSRCWPTVSASLGFFHERFALSMAACLRS
jgi:hypothetical protein